MVAEPGSRRLQRLRRNKTSPIDRERLARSHGLVERGCDRLGRASPCYGCPYQRRRFGARQSNRPNHALVSHTLSMAAHPDAQKPELLGIDFRTKRLTSNSTKAGAVGGTASIILCD